MRKIFKHECFDKRSGQCKHCLDYFDDATYDEYNIDYDDTEECYIRLRYELDRLVGVVKQYLELGTEASESVMRNAIEFYVSEKND